MGAFIMIRLIFAAIFLVVFLIISIPIQGIEYLIGKVNKKAADMSSLRIVQWALRCILAICGTNIIIKGEENIPKDHTAVFIGNHRSIFDIVIAYTLMPGRTGFIAKNSLDHIPSFSTWMKRLYCLFLDRSSTRDGLRVILTAIDYVKNGISVFVYPEGTRTKTGEMAPFKEGSFKIATKTGCPIIPVAFSNTENIFEAHFPLITAVTVVVHFGEPIDPNDFEDKKKIGAYTQGIIAEMLEEDKDLY